jgi:hypothetical protein
MMQTPKDKAAIQESNNASWEVHNHIFTWEYPDIFRWENIKNFRKPPPHPPFKLLPDLLNPPPLIVIESNRGEHEDRCYALLNMGLPSSTQLIVIWIILIIYV